MATTDAWVSAMTELERNDTRDHRAAKAAGITIHAAEVLA
jgi:hypothetical protein